MWTNCDSESRVIIPPLRTECVNEAPQRRGSLLTPPTPNFRRSPLKSSPPPTPYGPGTVSLPSGLDLMPTSPFRAASGDEIPRKNITTRWGLFKAKPVAENDLRPVPLNGQSIIDIPSSLIPTILIMSNCSRIASHFGNAALTIFFFSRHKRLTPSFHSQTSNISGDKITTGIVLHVAMVLVVGGILIFGDQHGLRGGISVILHGLYYLSDLLLRLVGSILLFGVLVFLAVGTICCFCLLVAGESGRREERERKILAEEREARKGS